jgi:nitrous-oxide reductase
VINWKKAAELVAQGKAKKINGHDVLMMETAIKEGILFLIPEPKSPHGVDVTPDGKFLTVAGKLDTHVSVYSFEKIMAAIKAGKFESKDPYGIPVIGMKDALHTQVSLGLGPLHTQYDSKPCVAYTSLYVDSQVAKWNYCEGKVLDKISVHYNIGHLMTMEGDSTKPAGKYLVALNKLAIDRFVPVGPLHPQNHQLIDISGDKMQLLYDMPLPLGEPHYVVAIDATKLKPAVRYKVGTDSRTDKPHPGAVRAGEEKTVKKGNKVEVYATLIRSHITPETIEVDVGDEVTIHLTNLERAQDETHGFTVSTYNVHASVEPGKTVSVKFKADKEGVYPYYCTEFCSALHLEMQGYLLVKPKGWKPTKTTAGQGQLHRSRLQGDREEGCRHPGGHRLRRGLHHQRELQGLPGCRGDGGRRLRPARQDQGPRPSTKAPPPRRTGSRPTCGPSRSGNTRSRPPTSACVPRPSLSRRAPSKAGPLGVESIIR